ncbi:sulfatase-like hydrolase/transferase, partial [Persicitalea sp.]|uniref:sulfatase-like hydrolase/transferase n=1 Tax=Persicitalea sp. TaxID=3100273 RepID=UPI003593B6F9
MTLSRLRNLAFVAILSGTFSCSPSLAQDKVNAAQPNRTGGPAARPNIIFILVDDMGWGDLGVFWQKQRMKANDRSEPWQFTPALDKMAESGAMLTNHYCSAPVCAPSRA